MPVVDLEPRFRDPFGVLECLVRRAREMTASDTEALAFLADTAWRVRLLQQNVGVAETCFDQGLALLAACYSEGDILSADADASEETNAEPQSAG